MCTECGSKFSNKQSLNVHRSKNKNSNGILECKIKKERKKEAKRKRKEESALVASLNKTQILNAVEQQETTKDLLKNLTNEVRELRKQNTEQTYFIREQNQKVEELKDIMIDIQNNPQLVLVCNQLYPLNTLKELDLCEPRFEPVRQILDTELPEYANLASKPTATVHCKAVKQLNMVHPTAVQDGKQVFYKSGNIMSKDINHETTKAFIEAIANSGYEYAQKAKRDLKANLESDHAFKEQVLNNASKDSVPTLGDLQIKKSD